MRFLYALSALLLAPATRAQETFYTLASPNEEVVGQFGYAVGSTGDLTGDGVGDLIVGASRELVDGVRAGRAYVFSGPTGALVHTLSSPHGRPDGSFGWSADGAGDVDLDGVPDLIVGAWAERGVGSALQAGRAYVFSGASGVLLHELHSPNEEVEGHFGHAVTGVG
ncbi:MAG TPA: integrin alpha, partial [Rubricoccaceae bacterium]|nr:integrin alpha [Rubricoccaceae bacterium]